MLAKSTLQNVTHNKHFKHHKPIMNNEITARLEALREVMKREKLSAFIFPSTDEHNSEYVPYHWHQRQWISGFDGSAGTAVVTMSDAALWTDSRYFLAAEKQLAGTSYTLMRQKVEGTPTISQWLSKKLSIERNPMVGIDGKIVPYQEICDLKDELKKGGGIGLRTNFDPLDVIWKDRPGKPLYPVEIQPEEFAGESAGEKIQRIRERLRTNNAEGIIISALDDVAWTLNLRGRDVEYTPVFLGYLIVTMRKATLFVNDKKLTPEVRSYLQREQVDIRPYEDVATALERYGGYSIIASKDALSYWLFSKIKAQIVDVPDMIARMKAVKNEAEIRGFRSAMLRDGVAMTKFLSWLLPAVKRGRETELSVSQRLLELRQRQEKFRDLSFATISGYGAAGAIVHYEPTKESDNTLRTEGLLLLDSGAQYQDGTTDITRTIALGEVSEEEKHVYTLVLKGHIALERLKFPKGATGTQLDAVARSDMWREGLNYLHGTGHGVGSFLSVHEGPHQIRMEYKPTPLQAGMTVTDEPGLYLAGRFGVRIENTLLIVPYKTTEFGDFLGFEPLTLCPIDLSPVDFSMLTIEERQWLNEYHKRVYTAISPYLDDKEKAWLQSATKAV